jgi:hypothetical protein
MSRLDHFLVLHRRAADSPALARDEQRLRALRLAGEPLHVLARGPLLIAWTGAPAPAGQAAFLRIVGDSYNVGTARPGDIAAGVAEAAGELDGAFAALAFDPGPGQCTLLTDRFGLVPLYVHEQAGSVCFSTSLHLLLSLRQPRCRVDPAAVAEMLLLRLVLGNRTLLREVGLVPPATALRLGEGELSAAPYWSWKVAATPRRPGDSLRDLVHETYALIEQAVLRGVPADGSCVALPLDGGLSSRLLLAVLTRHEVPVQVHARGGAGEGIAREVAQALGVPLAPLRVLDPTQSLPLAHEAIDCAYHIDQVGGWDRARQAAEQDGCAVLFDGLPLDLVLGAPLPPCADPDELARRMESGFAEHDEEALAGAVGELSGTLLQAVRSSLREQAQQSVQEAVPRAADHVVMTQHVRKHLFGACLANLAHLPGRFPFVTTRLFEHCLRLPVELRLDNALYRELLAEMFPELARIRFERAAAPAGAAHAPPGRWRRWLRGVVHQLSGGRVSLAPRGSFDRLFRTHEPLRQVILEVLHRDVPGLEGTLPPDLVAGVAQRHLAGSDLGGLVGGLYTVKHFLGRFVAPGLAALDRFSDPRSDEAPADGRILLANDAPKA